MSSVATDHETTHALLLDYVYGELDAPARSEVEKHLSTCARCQASLNQYQGTRRVMASYPPEPEPSAGLESLLDYAGKSAGRQRRAVRPTWLRWAFALVPTFALGAVALMLVPTSFHSAMVTPTAEHELGRTENPSPSPAAVAEPSPSSPSAEGAARRLELAPPAEAPPSPPIVLPRDLNHLAADAPAKNDAAMGGLAGAGGENAGAGMGSRLAGGAPHAASAMVASKPAFKKAAVAEYDKALREEDKRGRVADELVGASNVGSIDASLLKGAKDAVPPRAERKPMKEEVTDLDRSYREDGYREEAKKSKAPAPTSPRAAAIQSGRDSFAEAPAAVRSAAPSDDEVQRGPPLAQAAPATAASPPVIAPRQIYPSKSEGAEKQSLAQEQAAAGYGSQQRPADVSGADSLTLAEQLSHEGNHRGAAATYRQVYSSNPRGPRAAEALSREHQEELLAGDTDLAEKTLALLQQEFPGSRWTVQAIASRRSRQAGPQTAAPAAAAPAGATVDSADESTH